MRISPFTFVSALAFVFMLAAPASAEKILTITSDPAGATVEINGNNVGITPLQPKMKEFWFNGPKYLWSEFLSEPLQLTVSKEGYLPQTINITSGPYRWVNANNTAEKIFYVIRQTSFHIKLQSVAEASGMNLLPVNVTAVVVNSEPAGAEVYVDGKFESSTPSKLLLSSGEHVIRVTRPSYAPWERRITVELGAEKTLNAVLAAETQAVPPAATAPLSAPPTSRRPELVTLPGHAGGITALVFSPDGKTLASGGGDTVNLWDAASGRGLRTFGDGMLEFDDDSGTGVAALAFTPNGKTLASAATQDTSGPDDGPTWKTDFTLWDVESGKLVGRFAAAGSKVLAIAFSPNGRWLASGGTGNIVNIWDAATGQLVKSFTGHVDGVTFVMFTPDGTQVLSGSWDKAVDVWYAASATQLKTIEGNPAFTQGSPLAGPLSGLFHTSVTFNPAARMFASLGGLDGIVSLWNDQSNTKLKAFSWAQKRLSSVAFSPSGKVLAAGESGGGIKLWEVASGDDLLTIKEGQGSNSIALSPDGTVVAQSSEEGNSIRLWSTNDESSLKKLEGHTDTVNFMAFSPDNKHLASSGDDDTVRLWEVESGRVKVLKVETKVLGMGPVAFSPDGKVLVSIANNLGDDEDADLEIRVWDVATGKELRSLTPSEEAPNAIAFSPDGKLFAVGTRGKKVLVLDAASGQVVKTFSGYSFQIVSVAFINGETLQSWALDPDADETVLEGKMWHVPSGTLLKADRLTPATVPDQEQYFFGGLPFLGISEKFAILPLEGRGIEFFQRTGEPLNPLTQRPVATLHLFGDEDWLITTPEGFFDGSPGAWKHAHWRFNGNTFDNSTLELYFNEFFYPNLLQEVIAGKAPKPPNGFALEQVDRRQPSVLISEINGQSNFGFEGRRAAGLRTDKRTASVTVTVSDNLAEPKQPGKATTSGAQDLRLFRNGSLVRIWRGDLFQLGEKDGCAQLAPERPGEPRRVRCHADVPVVAGDNQISAYAFNREKVKSEDSMFPVEGAATLRRERTLYVLTIGVGQYENPQFTLGYPVKDAQDFGAEVRRRQEAVGFYQRVEVIPLLDQGARKDFILSALNTLAEAVQPEDGLIVYFSGHGVAQGDRFYLVPSDIGYKGPRAALDDAALQTIRAHSISDLELESAFAGIDAGRLLLIIDACYSGKALQAEDSRRGPMNTKGLGQMAYEKGMYVLTASQDSELAYESAALKHSYLAYALVEEGLRTKVEQADADGDGHLLLREWFAYARRRVPRIRLGEAGVTSPPGPSRSLEEGEAAERGAVQRPKVFYRREPEPQPFVIAKTARTSPPARKGAAP